MTGLFLSILNMTLTASIIICVVLLVRLCLRRAPKIYSYVLWSVVLFRLLCPFSISLPVSILSPMAEVSTSAGTSYTSSMEYISSERDSTVSEQPDALVPGEMPQLPAQGEDDYQTNNTQDDRSPIIAEKDEVSAQSGWYVALTVLGWIWASGCVAVLGITGLQTLNLRKRLATACIIRGNIYESENIDTAFVFGIFNPKIYLPLNLPFGVQKAVIAHEQTHLRRGDHIVKLVSYIALAIHWFNPLVWLSFKLMCADMEKSCDESAVRKLHERGYEMKSVKGAYSKMLLHLGGGGNLFSPVSFAENNIKERVKNIFEYTKRKRKVAIALTVVVILSIITCVFNPSISRNAPADLSGSAESQNNADSGPEQNIAEIESGDTAELITVEHHVFFADAVRLSVDSIYDSSVLVSLNQFPNLEELYITVSTISDFSFLYECENLKSLEIDSCEIQDVHSLSNLTQLEKLEINRCYGYSANELSDVLAGLTQLKSLYITHSMQNGLEDENFLSVLGKMIQLTELTTSISCQNDVQNIASLANLEKIRLYVDGDVSGNINFSALSELTMLRELTLQMDNANEKCMRNILDSVKSISSLISITINPYAGRAPIPQDSEYWADFPQIEILNVCLQENIKSLSFVDKMTNLHELYISNDSSTVDISALRTHPQLRAFAIYCGSITEPSAFEELSQLEHLSVSAENVQECVLHLQVLDKLEYLYLYSLSDINDLSFLVNTPNVEELNIWGVNANDLMSIAQCSSMERLGLQGNISDISFTENLENLLYFAITSDSLEDISPLAGCAKLRELVLSSGAVNDVSHISSCTELVSVEISRAQISDISFAYSLPKLRELELIGVPISQEQVDAFCEYNPYCRVQLFTIY